MKIYAYSNPFKINEMPLWKELRKYPHLCISETLVQGLSHKYGREEFSYLCTIDRFINSFYKEWKDDAENDLMQYIDLANAINDISDEKIKKSMRFNKNDLFKATKLLIECEIGEKDIDISLLSKEQKEFFYLYKLMKEKESWKKFDYSMDKGIENVRNALLEVLAKDIGKEIKTENTLNINEIQEEINREIIRLKLIVEKKERNNSVLSLTKKAYNMLHKEKDLLKRLTHYKSIFEKSINSNDEINKIIFHGVHQFTPIICKVINHLESIGIEVIFLLNYCEEYKNVYETWDNVYKWTNEKIHVCGDLEDFIPQNFGENLGKIIEGDVENLSEVNESVIKFDNITSFSDYVAKFYEDAEKESDKKVNKETREKNKMKETKNVLSEMEEQFYAVNGENVNRLLRIYFPEQFGEKHFLSYPIGQFILALYNMWDGNSNKLKIDENQLRECLSVNLWKSRLLTTPVQLFDKLKLYFKDLEDIDEYLSRIDNLDLYLKRVLKEERYIPFRKFSFFSISEEELNYFRDIIIDIKNITNVLFENKNGMVNIKEHYKKLIGLLIERVDKAADISEKEIDFVKEIAERLENNISMNESTAIEDIRETLHFYLYKKAEGNSANWIVRDFEQIDGGILLAAEGVSGLTSKAKVYHYAELSDKNMRQTINARLPWPLTEDIFISGKNGTIDIILNSKREYKNFLRYNLFYGTFFLRRNLKLSYIETSEDEIKDVYFILKILGLDVINDNTVRKNDNSIVKEIDNLQRELLNTEDISEEDKELFQFCPERYFFNGLLEGSIYFTSEFQCRYYLIVLITLKLRKNLKNSNINSAERYVKTFINSMRKMFPFWNTTDFYDIENKIRNDLYKTSKNGLITGVDESYERIKSNFLMKKFTNYSTNETRYLNGKIDKKLIINYIKREDEETEDFGFEDMCKYCNQREICMKCFLEDELNV